MVEGLEDGRVGNPKSGISQQEIRALAAIFEKNLWRNPWKLQVRPYFPADTN
jgi:hypothetical protein